jgi:hypothetical protein
MKRYCALALALMQSLTTSVLAEAPSPESQDAPKQPRTLGQKAVLHIYYYSPQTLEITYVDSYLFKDEGACRSAMGAALQIAMPHAGSGDRVSAKCVGLRPPQPGSKPDTQQAPAGSTEL